MRVSIEVVGAEVIGAEVIVANGIGTLGQSAAGRRSLAGVGIAIVPRVVLPICIDNERRCLGLLLGPRLRACAPRNVGCFTLGVPPASRNRAVVQADGISKCVELLLGQLTRVADPEVVERQVCEGDPLELVDLEAERLDHPVDLAMLAFVDRDAEPRVLALAGQDLDLGGHRDGAIVERDAIAQRLDVVALEPAVNLDVIGLRDVIRWREQARRELAVVGQQQHAFGVEIEATDRLHRYRQVRQIVHHRRPAAVVGHGGDAAFGLIEQHVKMIEGDDRLAVHQDRVVVGVDLRAEHGHDRAVHLHAAGDDQILGLATCGDPSGREIPLQADRGTHRLLRGRFDV